MTAVEEVAMLNAVVTPRAKEHPFSAYMRLATQELAFFGHKDAEGNIIALTATAAVPSRAELVEGWLAVPVVEIREIDGRSVSSPPFRLTMAQAERKVAMNRGEIPRPSRMEILWSGWADLLREEAA